MSERKEARSTFRSPLIWLMIALILAGLGWWQLGDKQKPAPKGPPPGMNPSTPVRVDVARLQDLDIYLRGLGTVTALNTVVVRSRVQGELLEILFKEGEQVKEGALLALIDPRPYEVALNQALGTQQQNVSQYENAKRDLQRYQTLRKQDSIAPQLLDTQAALVKKFEGQIKSDQATVDNARLQLSYTRITAPISGKLGLRRVDAGNLVNANDPLGLVVITETQPISVVFTLPENDLPAVRQPMRAGEKLDVDAYDRADAVRLAQGTLMSIDNQIDITTGTVKLKAEFKNDDDALFPNQFVNVRMKVRTIKGALTIPAGGIQQGNRGAFVYVVGPEGTATVRLVKVGDRTAESLVILEGIKEGERVVLEGTDRLREGAKVRVIESGR
ncbi:MAG: MdtA/MuxA family multidrug efflux RND transporter periplasmic adaptor subunit [Burkholderiaceae bacterium]|jgi:membrane fusion protein, multidrug efflux system|nr:MdtA/MuxA family multidrug efflux RND transporter periplasmic adaptor subunit [Burkholderiaceae bacterium]MDP4968943.1 MdtA/MuxA family multidrug efflux RND transporter periplasmic adaptor subunit [Burkholderiaceae bacterium]MDP5110986.1 MdtA/MuxA family multidrug efflux RND transporter periplasmic adaptor subunit [Burkholderiaceae bacterium]